MTSIVLWLRTTGTYSLSEVFFTESILCPIAKGCSIQKIQTSLTAIVNLFALRKKTLEKLNCNNCSPSPTQLSKVVTKRCPVK